MGCKWSKPLSSRSYGAVEESLLVFGRRLCDRRVTYADNDGSATRHGS